MLTQPEEQGGEWGQQKPGSNQPPLRPAELRLHQRHHRPDLQTDGVESGPPEELLQYEIPQKEEE